MKRGAKGAAYITEYPNEVKISLRLSKSLSSKKIIKYRVDALAQSMSGGGHMGAMAHEMHLESKITHISTGGGATINFLTGKKLDLVLALEAAAKRM